MNIDSIVMSWNEIKKQYTISILTRKDGLIMETADTIQEAIHIFNTVEEKYAA